MTNTVPWPRRVTAATTALAFTISQLVIPTRAEASHLGSSTVSAGSVPPPSVSAIQSFQPDLFTGRATTSIPIAVPPGRKGMQPSLALGYSSSGRNSWLGVGWNLDLGYIERSTKNGVPKYDASDTFTFMFQGVTSDLVKIPDGTYRAKDEGLFLRFEDKGVAGWEVRDKSGTRYLFGQASGSQIIDAGRAFRWSLDQVIDTNGNSLTITYTKDQNQLYPTQIRYTAHDPSGLPPANQVDLILEDRPDPEVSYRSGFAVRTTKRLKTIETKATVGGTLSLARRYALTYAASARTGRSLLRSVTQIGSDGTTNLPPVTFSYQDAGAPAYSISSSPGFTGTAAWNVRVAEHSFRHEVFSCGESVTHPYAGLSWQSPRVVAPGSGTSIGCVSASVGSGGTLSVSGCQDRYVHGWIWLHRTSAGSISLNITGAEAGFCAWIEVPGGGVSLDSSPSSIAVPAGWSILHLTTHHEHSSFSAQQNAALTSQVNAVNPSQFLKPQLTGDVDGNGITDLITFDAVDGVWSVALSRGPNFSPASTWRSGFGGASSIPLLGDWNADGRTDLAIYNGGSWQFATSTGTNFEMGTVPNFSSAGDTPFTGDFNGDGRVDIGTYNGGSWTVALNTGTGFSAAGSFNLNWSVGRPLTGDFNGDGLTDIAGVSSSGDVSVRLSTGSGWTGATTWAVNFGAGSDHTSGDFNGDGLTDVAYYDTSTGQVRFAASTGVTFGTAQILSLTFDQRSADDGLQLGDFNGDGLSDPAIVNAVSGQSQLTRSLGVIPDLLTGIANGVGGTTSLEYQPSTQCDNMCPIEQVPVLPFIIPVARRVTLADGLGNSYATSYFYEKGRYDPPTREFRGFGRVEVRDAASNVTITEFHQDEHKKGRPLRTEFRDADGNTWTKTEQTWSCTEPYSGVHFTKLDQTDAYLYDGDETFRHVRSRVEYDAYGNVTAAYEDGEPTVSGDERSSRTTFTYNTTAWILNKPSLTQTLNGAGAVVAQRRFFYDAVSNLTKEDEWLNVPTEQWLATQLAYDTYGNVTSVTDALSRTTTNAYDATGTFLTAITNTLNHSRQLVYDARTGQVTSSTDQNGVATTTEYDVLGRVTKVIGPNDTAALPTMRYEYDLSTVPARTTVRTRLVSGQSAELTSHAFSDGLGRTIQTRSPAEDPTKQVVGGAVEFNVLGQVVKQWAPYLDNASSSYVPHTGVSGLAQPVTYSYDAAGRLLTTTDPDGTITSTSYDDWSVAATDANGNQTRRTSDSFGRLATVEEFNGAEIYTTTYEYDTLNNLVNVTDVQNNVTTISYDSFGRKVSMNDPDMGVWTYVYDAVDNLTSQTDARGVITTFTYDALNRLKRKDYSVSPPSSIFLPPSVLYTYDNAAKPFSKGKLTEIADGSGNSSFEYDKLGRLTKESKTVDSTTYTIQRAYDLLGRFTTLTYPDGESAAYTYNAQGGIETISLQPVSGGPQSIVTNIDYNAAGQLIKIAYGNGTVTDYSYNPQTLRLDRLITAGPGGSLQDFRYSFDPGGNVSQITDAVHTGTQSFQYDDLNRLTRATGAYGTLSYAYDPIGNMTEKEGVAMTYGAGAAGPHAVTATSAGLTLSYDSNGNLIQKSTDYGLPTTDLTAQQFTYDAENRLVEVKTAQEETVTVTLKAGWNFFSLPVIPDNLAVSATFQNFAQDFEQIAKRESSGQFKHYVGNAMFDDFTELEYGVGYEVYAKREVSLTIQGKLPSQQLSKSLGAGWHLLPAISTQPTPVSTVFGSLSATAIKGYDATTQSLTTTTQVEPGKAYYVQLSSAKTWTPPLPKNPSSRYVYDGDGGRVKQITASGTTAYLGEVYEVRLAAGAPEPPPDPIVREVEWMPVKSTGGSMPEGWNLWSEGYVEDTVTITQPGAYDLTVLAKGQEANGWPILELSVDGTLVGTFTVASSTWQPWTAQHTLSAGAHTVRMAFTNDYFAPPLDRNLHLDKLTISPVATAPPLTSTGSTKYVFAGSQRLAAKSSDGSLRFYHSDHLGSSNVITNASGQLMELAEHTPYGSLHHREGTVNTAHKFTGQRLDAATGLYFYQARYYDPQLGRFIQPDIYIQSPADPQFLNRYSYVRNNPINLVDPSGNLAFLAVLGTILVKAAIGAAIGAVTSVAVGAITGQIHSWKDVGRLALSGAASGAILGGGGYALGLAAKTLEWGRTAVVLAKAGLAAVAGAVDGGTNTSLQGGSFSEGAGVGAVGGLLGYGVAEGLGWMGHKALDSLLGSAQATGNQVALSQQARKLLQHFGLGGKETPEITYRALNAKDAERLAMGLGLEAKNPAGAWSAGEHIRRGSQAASWLNDPWIATSRDLDVTRAFNSGRGIVKIDLSKVPGRKVRAWEIYPRANGEIGIPYHHSIWQQETSIYKSIPREAIVGFVE